MNAIGVESIVKQYNARSWNKPNNLDTISIDDLNLFLNFDNNKKYKDLASEILNQVNNSKNSKFIDSPLIDASFEFLKNGKDIANEFESEQNIKFDLIISVPTGKANWFGQTNPLTLTLHTAPKPPIPPTPSPTPHNNGLSSWAWFGIIIASILVFIGIPYCVYKFYIVPKKVAKRWKKFKQESQENNESESE